MAALVYTYVPYHLLNLYVRANLAESMAFVWLPLCLWAVRQAVIRPSVWAVIGCALSYAGLMLTSNLVIVLFTPLLVVYTLVLLVAYALPPGAGRLSWGSRLGAGLRRALAPALGGLAGLGLSAVFWLPMLLERQYVREDQWFDGRYSFRGHFVYFFQLFSPAWGFGASEPGPDDPMGFQLGAVALLLAGVGFYLAWRRLGRLRWEVACLLTVGLVTVLLTLQWTAPLWELPVIGTVLGFAQFPWRWFSVATVCLSVLAGLAFYDPNAAPGAGLTLPLAGVAALVILASYPLLRVEIIEPAEGPVGLAALMRFQQSSDEMTGSTAWVKEIPSWSPIADEYIRQERDGETVRPVTSMVDYTTVSYDRQTGFVVHSEAHNSISEEVFYWSPLEGRRIVFNQFYYPGWKAYLLDGRHGAPVQELPVIPEEEGTLGRMTVPVPTGEGYVLLRFEDTPPRTIGRILSLATVGVLLAAGMVTGWIERRERIYE